MLSRKIEIFLIKKGCSGRHTNHSRWKSYIHTPTQGRTSLNFAIQTHQYIIEFDKMKKIGRSVKMYTFWLTFSYFRCVKIEMHTKGLEQTCQAEIAKSVNMF